MDSLNILVDKEYTIDRNHSFLFPHRELESSLRDPDDKLSAFSLISFQIGIVLIINQLVFILLFIRGCSTMDWEEEEQDRRRVVEEPDEESKRNDGLLT